MQFKKELSKACRKCGVVFDETLSNKRKGRAMCIPCYNIEIKRISKAQVDARAVIGAAIKRIELYRDYKFVNRKGYWREINKQIKPLTDRVEIREFISKQMDRILADDNLMKYISAMSIAEQRENEKQIK
jgi:protein-arginine kinase activator protein McsA